MFYILVRFAPVSLLERFLDFGATLPKNGTNPLLYATYYGKTLHAQTLLVQGICVNTQGWVCYASRQMLPLEAAVIHEHHELVDLFLAEGSQMAHLLIDAGCNPSLCNSHGKTPLHVAAVNGHTAVIEYLLTLEDIHVLAFNGDSVLHAIMDHSDGHECLEMAYLLIDAGCNPSLCNSHGKTPIHVAVVNGHTAIIQKLIAKGADIHVLASNGNSLLHVIMDHSDGHECLEMAHLLIDAGCNPSLCNSHGETPLHVAAANGHISVIEYLLTLDIPFPDDILFLVMEVYELVPLEIMRRLIAKGANVHVLASNADNLLHVAIFDYKFNRCQCLKVTKLLIDAGCDPCLSNSNGETPIHGAVAGGYINVVEYLLSMNIPLPHDILLSAMEADQDQVELIHMLIDKGADVHILTSNGDSLLHVFISLYGS
ncbi:hypothetical protein PAXINDRAFT_88070 [Paxillus involutus ATCC 200175]|uniref:Ankyrin n=1 Tax=Paxillus involutus ATCC 200175 TaxID=664439 RepID=A0A0C9TMK5_PAXIN|nr:hypothetical protein PAXINDRAFT_88070 [Paxillus involutus ATCC 200175]